MEQSIEIRTDIIDPLLYCKIKLYYEEIIKIIDSLYGYMLYQHFAEIFTENKDLKARRFIKKMESEGIIKSIRLSNNKYLKLEGVAIKYLQQQKKISFLLDNPGYKLLYRSFFAAKYYIKFDKIPVTVKTYLNSQGITHALKQNNLYYKNKSEFVNFVMFDFDQTKFTYYEILISLDSIFTAPYTLTISTKSKERQNQLKNHIEEILKNNNLILNSDKKGRAFAFDMEKGLQKIAVIDYEIEKYFRLNTSVEKTIHKKREVDKILEIAERFH